MSVCGCVEVVIGGSAKATVEMADVNNNALNRDTRMEVEGYFNACSPFLLDWRVIGEA